MSTTQNKNRLIRSTGFCITLTILFFLFHLIGITRHSFWTDELHTYESSLLPMKELITNRMTAGQFPTYYILIHYWCKFVGFSELSMRIPSLVFASISFLTFFFLCKRFMKDNLSFSLAIFLFFFHPYIFWSAQEARMYSLLILISLLSSYYLLTFIETTKNPYLIAYSMSVFVGMNLHILFAFQIIIHFFFLLLHYRKLLFRWIASLIIPGLIFLIMYYLLFAVQKEYSPGLEVEVYRIGKYIKKIASLAFITPDGFAGNYYSLEDIVEKIPILFFAVFLVSSIVYLIKYTKRNSISQNPIHSDEEKKILLLKYSFYSVLIMSILIYIIDSFFYQGIGGRRHYSLIIPMVIIIMIIGFVNLKKNIVFRMFQSLFFVAFFGVLLLQMSWKGQGVGEGINFLKENYKNKDGVIYCREEGTKSAFSFYNIEYMSRIGINHRLEDTEQLLDTVKNYAFDKQRIWLCLYRSDDSPLPELLEEHPEILEKFLDKKFFEVEIRGFTVEKTK